MLSGASLESTSPNHHHYRYRIEKFTDRVRIISKKYGIHCPFKKEDAKLRSKQNRKLKGLSAKRKGHGIPGR